MLQALAKDRLFSECEQLGILLCPSVECQCYRNHNFQSGKFVTFSYQERPGTTRYVFFDRQGAVCFITLDLWPSSLHFLTRGEEACYKLKVHIFFVQDMAVVH